MASTVNTYLPLSFKQITDLVLQLPKKEKEKLVSLLQKDEDNNIPQWQKDEVKRRIDKYNLNPELLIDEETAIKLINEM